jgi:hypothetical protein
MNFDRVYRWRRYCPELYGKRCRIVARGAMNSALVEFENGVRRVVSRWAIRKVNTSGKEEHGQKPRGADAPKSQ